MATTQRWLAATVAWMAIAAPLQAQTPALEAAIALYTDASYDEALTAFDAVAEPQLAPADRVELARYRMLCLLALGRQAAAGNAAERLLEQRPEFVLSEADAAPHVRAVLDATRRRFLPVLIRQTYDTGKRAFDAGDYARAREVFTQLEQWLGDAAVQAVEPRSADLRTLSEGFRSLSVLGVARQAIQPAAASVPAMMPALPPIEAYARSPWAVVPGVQMQPPSLDAALDAPDTVNAPAADETVRTASTTPSLVATGADAAAPIAPPPFAPLDIFTFGIDDSDVVPPQAVSQAISGWWGRLGEPPPGTLLGTLDLVIDQHGRVVDARVHESINRIYDAVLLQSLKQWQYEPARRDGRPVRYRRFSRIVSGR